MHELTQKQIKYFTSEVTRWAEFWGINDWQVLIDCEGEGDAAYATCFGDIPSRLSVISLSPEWDIEPTDERLSRNAFHEVCELLLMEMSTLADQRYTTEEALEGARHKIVRVLENVVWKANK